MDHPDPTLIERLERLYLTRGQRLHADAQAERVTALEHALQCAQLAEWADAEESLVAAAFLHDVGHLLHDDPVAGHEDDDRHALQALQLLRPDFGSAVTEPIRLHVAAKRYLCARDGAYLLSLSPASRHALLRQGGVMTDDEARAFETRPHAVAAVQLRRWDDLARTPGQRTPPLGYYLRLLDSLLSREPSGTGPDWHLLDAA
jgi:phosphonate degradation associated HDIG domain protein